MIKKITKLVMIFAFLISGNVFAHANVVSQSEHVEFIQASVKLHFSQPGLDDDVSSALHCGVSNFICAAEQHSLNTNVSTLVDLIDGTRKLVGVVVFQKKPPPKLNFL